MRDKLKVGINITLAHDLGLKNFRKKLCSTFIVKVLLDQKGFQVSWY